MAPRTIAAGRVLLGLSLFSITLAFSNCKTGGDHGFHTYAFPVAGDHLVYVAKQGAIADVTVHVTGNPKSTGDQLAWVAVDGTPIASVTIPDPSAPPTNPPCPAPSWNPFLHKESTSSNNASLSGALNVAGLPPPPDNGPWCVPYSVNFQGVGTPIYGRVIIVRP